MTIEQTWELLEIHRLLIDQDKHKNSIGVSLLVDFIENHLFKAESLEWVSCVKCDSLIQKDIAEEELGMCVNCSHNYFDHKEDN